jgi:hypothetical protein
MEGAASYDEDTGELLYNEDKTYKAERIEP